MTRAPASGRGPQEERAITEQVTCHKWDRGDGLWDTVAAMNGKQKKRFMLDGYCPTCGTKLLPDGTEQAMVPAVTEPEDDPFTVAAMLVALDDLPHTDDPKHRWQHWTYTHGPLVALVVATHLGFAEEDDEWYAITPAGERWRAAQHAITDAIRGWADSGSLEDAMAGVERAKIALAAGESGEPTADELLDALEYLFDAGFLRRTRSGNVIVEYDKSGVIIAACDGTVRDLATAIIAQRGGEPTTDAASRTAESE